MALTQEGLVRILMDLDSLNSSVKHAAQVRLDKIQVEEMVEQLLAIISHVSCSVEDQTAAAKHLADVFAWKGKEFFTGLAQKKKTNEFLESFFNCFEVGATSEKSVMDGLLTAFADMVHFFVVEKESWPDESKKVLGQLQAYVESEDDQERMIGWTVLASVPKALDTVEFLEWMVKVIPRDLTSSNVDLKFAATTCVFGHP